MGDHMSNAVAQRTEQLPAMEMEESKLVEVLGKSLYPGASIESIKLVLGYCKASGLDPMQKPAHIVPMWDSKSGAMRDIIMPGIGLYRTQAARSGKYAGVSEPEYGEEITESIDGCTFTYPKWCKVIVKRLLSNGALAEFSATERWKENYAVKGGKQRSQAPNAMWHKRPFAQIAKCAEAQALRKAFPECGAAPTNDEMEGKVIDMQDITNEATAVIKNPATPSKNDVLKEIASADSRCDLFSAGKKAAQLKESDREECRASYRARLDVLIAASNENETKLGEVVT